LVPIDANSTEVSTPADAPEIGAKVFYANEALVRLIVAQAMTQIGGKRSLTTKALKSASFGSDFCASLNRWVCVLRLLVAGAG
jgi:hypothetical protein